LLAFGTPDGEVIIWDRAGGRLRARAQVNPQNSLAIAFASDSQSLSVCGEGDGTITAFDTATGHQLWNVELGLEMATGGISYSPDGKTVVTSHGGALRFFDAATGNLQDGH
jgi:WD40 repeat protein